MPLHCDVYFLMLCGCSITHYDISQIFHFLQLSILALLARPQHIHVHSPADYMMSRGSGVGGRSSEAIVWLEKRVHHLKDEMFMVEAQLERMWHEHALLKAQLEDLKHLSKHR